MLASEMFLLSLLHLVTARHALHRIRAVTGPFYESVWSHSTNLFLLFGEVHQSTTKANSCLGPPQTHCHLSEYISRVVRANPSITFHIHLEIPEEESDSSWFEEFHKVKVALSMHAQKNATVYPADFRIQEGITAQFLTLLAIATRQKRQELKAFFADKKIQQEVDRLGDGKPFFLEHEFGTLSDRATDLNHIEAEKKLVMERIENARKNLEAYHAKIYKYFKRVNKRVNNAKQEFLSGDWANLRDFIYDFIRDEMEIMDISVLINMLRETHTVHFFFGGADHATKYAKFFENKLKCTRHYSWKNANPEKRKCCQIMSYDKLEPLFAQVVKS